MKDKLFIGGSLQHQHIQLIGIDRPTFLLFSHALFSKESIIARIENYLANHVGLS